LSLHKECVGSQTVIHPSSSLDKDTVCEGSVVLGPNVHVTASYLKDCMLFGESTIQDSHLEECILDTQCHLQGVDLHYSMLRAKTVLRK
jgi:bifunctional N-acetylglucosamine-1-phosphate-uridyltransferase/glucosamine-1-phosphate-acetyltransferase GlmU-like protein